MPEERAVDPRFDPRYQRGFDPTSVPMPPEPVAVRPASDEPTRVPPTQPVAAPPSAGAAGVDASDDDFPDDDEFVVEPRRNPYRLTLLLVSVGLLVLAAATLWWVATNQGAYLYGSAAESPQGWMFQQLTGILPPAAILAGFVGLVIWLGLGALDARDRREKLRDE